MAILWMDGFDHYGGLRANLTLGAYSYVGGSVELYTSIVRTGTYSLSASSVVGGLVEVIWNFPSVKTEFGCGFGYYIATAPDGVAVVAQFRNAVNEQNATLVVTSSGALQLRRGSFIGTVLLETDPCITFGVWNHIEFHIGFSDSDGFIYIRVNEVPVSVYSGSETGLDNVASGTVACAMIVLFGANSPRVCYDDFYVWDETGTQNNDFIGDRRVITLLPNANEATQEMTVTGAANAYTAIQSADGDTSYITASDSVPVTSEFALEDPGATVGAINAVQVVTLMRKIEAGPANVQASLLSGSDASAGTNHSITDSYAYYADIHNTDPATGAPWSNSGLAAARLRLRRNT